jgi:RNA polymerase sigma factor (sigma-70 family)
MNPIPITAAADAARREALIVDNLPLVRAAARRLVAQLAPCYELDDLISEGVIGLMRAVESFDASKNVPFEAWALIKIRGQMLQHIRDERKRHHEELFESTLERQSYDPVPALDAEASRTAIMAHVLAAAAQLPDREQEILERLYFDSEGLRAIGEALGVGKAYACRLHRKALDLLRRELARRGDLRAAA